MDIMKKILMKVISFLVVLSVLSTCVFAYDSPDGTFSGDGFVTDDLDFDHAAAFLADLAVRPQTLDSSLVPFSIGASFEYNRLTNGNLSSGSLTAVNSVGDSSTATVRATDSSFKYKQLYFYPQNAGQATVTLSPVSSDVSFSVLNPNLASVTYNVSNNVATVIISMTQKQFDLYTSYITDPSLQTVVAMTVSGTSNNTSTVNLALSYVSFEEPPPDVSGNGSMFGWTGSTLFGLSLNNGQAWFEYVNGDIKTADMFSTVQYNDAGMLDTTAIAFMLNSLTYSKWKWQIGDSGLPEFGVMDAQAGSWADMIYRTSVYNYFWQNKLWSDDVSGSWFGVMQSRISQILDVLANDEDVVIKDSTTEERNWVKDYFTGSGDKADSSKYDDLNDTGSAFKDVFEGAPDTSIADGFTAVNDNGYTFWSQAVSDDINGASAASGSRAPVSPEQRIVDAYSENWAQIVGGYYD